MAVGISQLGERVDQLLAIDRFHFSVLIIRILPRPIHLEPCDTPLTHVIDGPLIHIGVIDVTQDKHRWQEIGDGHRVCSVGVVVEVAFGHLLVIVWLEGPGVELDTHEEGEEHCDYEGAGAAQRCSKPSLALVAELDVLTELILVLEETHKTVWHFQKINYNLSK